MRPGTRSPGCGAGSVLAPLGAVRLSHGNPGHVICSGIDFGTEVWVSHHGLAIAVGRYMGGEVHPDRVFNRVEA